MSDILPNPFRDKKNHTYQSDTLALPPLKLVVGEVPEPDPVEKRRPLRAFNVDKNEVEAKNTVAKLIGHLKNKE
jgi:hypothetical protein